MTDQKSLTVSREINASADAIFDVLTLPQRHAEIDGSAMIVSDDRTQRIQAVGDTFTINMHAESQGGDYQMEDRKSTRLNSSHSGESRMPSSA